MVALKSPLYIIYMFFFFDVDSHPLWSVLWLCCWLLDLNELHEMDVKPISPSKHAVPSPAPLPEKHHRILPTAQLDTLSNYMKCLSNSMNWRTRVKEAKDNDMIWWQTHSYILMNLIEQLRATDMESVVIHNWTYKRHRTFLKASLKRSWKSGTMAWRVV